MKKPIVVTIGGIMESTEHDSRLSISPEPTEATPPHLSNFWCVLFSPQERTLVTRLLKINQAVLEAQSAIAAGILAEEPVTAVEIALEQALTRSSLRKLTPP
jgi:hypothetical protein